MSKRLRLLLVMLAVVIGGVFLYPTVRWYLFIPDDRKELANGSRNQVRDYARQQANEVVDRLRSAAGEDPDAPLTEDLRYLQPLALDAIRLEGGERPESWTTVNLLASFRDEADLFRVVEEYHRVAVEELKELRSRIILLGLDLSGGISVVLEADTDSLAERLEQRPTAEQTSEAIDLAMEILTNRIDRFGITEPQIRRIDETQISIELPGADDRERVNAFLVGKGRLNFHIVDDEITGQLIEYQGSTPDWSLEESGAPDFVRAGLSVVEYITRDEYGIDRSVRHIVIKDDVTEHGLDGIHITEAQAARDPLSNQPVVNFILDNEGSSIFSKLTRDNVNSSMAIVLDDHVRAYATIQEEIPTGQVRISGFDDEEAQNIARVLRTAALPINLSVVNQQTVGSQLGEEAITAGLRAMALGFVLVVLFMVVYYKRGGLIADLMLLLNLFFIVSILSVFNLTLTLTSIAGIILTVGIAVDANVIIFERMKEEYRLGKTPKAAVKAGFQKAFWTIMDANITTFIAALFLSQFGSGPIQGFAVTLSVGIVGSMFTTLVISRLIFDFAVDTLKVSRLSIGWRLQ